MKIALSDGCDYLFLANNDIVLEPTTLAELVDAGESTPDVGAVGPVQLRYEDPTKVISAGGEVDWRRCLVKHYKTKPLLNREVEFLSGAAFLIKAVAVQRLGFLDESYYFYGEDVDLSTRLRRNHYQLVCVASAVIKHHVEGSSHDSAFRIYHMTRTRFILMQKHASFLDWLYFIPFFAKNGILGQYISLVHQGHWANANAIPRAILDFLCQRISPVYAEPRS